MNCMYSSGEIANNGVGSTGMAPGGGSYAAGLVTATWVWLTSPGRESFLWTWT
jgi:hypothetical protein